MSVHQENDGDLRHPTFFSYLSWSNFPIDPRAYLWIRPLGSLVISFCCGHCSNSDQSGLQTVISGRRRNMVSLAYPSPYTILLAQLLQYTTTLIVIFTPSLCCGIEGEIFYYPFPFTNNLHTVLFFSVLLINSPPSLSLLLLFCDCFKKSSIIVTSLAVSLRWREFCSDEPM